MALIGITTTIPVELLFASGHVPVDLNNIFITRQNPLELIERAEFRGLPRTLCSWIKGIYGILCERQDIETVVAVVEGDCSNTLPLLEILRDEGREVIPFSFPFDRDRHHLEREMEKLTARFPSEKDALEAWRTRLDAIRRKVHRVDELCWKEGKVTGLENHLYLVSSSDFQGEPDSYEKRLDEFIAEASERKSDFSMVPLGFVGVPPIFSDFYDFLEEKGAKVIFNEVQRQFSMPGLKENLVERFLEYTYPYGLPERIDDIRRETAARGLWGIIHYTQSFCHHQMEHLLLREKLRVPLLLLEGDRPGGLDERTKVRLESFLEMLR
ncbi:MAG: 2-hydroxyacyl-CoA dehydratase [Candidatus Eremiobacteraeota bacterium]|nr:2-hydroxyacyl-CoA dehydratase [Candidatus Eremiobacteraeota bacterium]